jgi:hypothetical protein
LYEVKGVLGQGGMGRVDRVWHRGWGRELAVKSILPTRADRAGAVASFQAEAEQWIDKIGLHPNIVGCCYVRMMGGLPRVFIELVDGGSLVERIHSGKLYEGGPEAALERKASITLKPDTIKQMSPNPFDQACRYHAKLDPIRFIAWLLEIAATQFAFRRWLDTRLLRFPGEPDRTCDTVAFLEDLPRGHVPWAMLIEFQIEPDTLMFGRILGYFGPLWLEIKPSDERGDRFQMGAIVVNLTGRGQASRSMDWPEAGLHTGLTIVERNLSERHADAELASIAAGTAPPIVLALIPLMQGGGEPVNIAMWLELAGREPDARRRGDYGGLALVFAEAAGCWEAWKEALKEWNVIQSKQVNEWQEQARNMGLKQGVDLGLKQGVDLGRKEGIDAGRTQMAAEMLVRVLKTKFGEIPDAVEKSIQSIGNADRLSDLLLHAAQSTTIEEWRQASPEVFNGAPH